MCVWFERVAVVHAAVRLDVGVRTGVTVRDWFMWGRVLVVLFSFRFFQEVAAKNLFLIS